jgi:hypothetical protein
MSQTMRTRITGPAAPDIVLPPAFRLVTLREMGDAFAHAVTHAAEEGAGTLIYVGRFDVVEFALVLEPDEELRRARRAFLAGMNAMADALSVHAPPEKPIQFVWPDAIHIDGGLAGGARLAWPEETGEDAIPDWLVFAATVRIVSMTDRQTALNPLAVALEEEGFADLGAGRLVETFARHFMVTLDAWQEEGVPVIARNFLHRLIVQKGARATLDDAGDLLLRWPGGEERHALAPALARPSWLDPATGGLRA